MTVTVFRFAAFLIAAYACSAWAGGALDASIVSKTSGADGGALPVLADGWLVSPAEAQTFRGQDGFNAPAALRARAIVPLIDILQPEPGGDLKVKTPFTISVVFKGQSDAAINPATFKVFYGALKIDITSRITQYVTVTKDGFSLTDAKIPSGKHRLTLQVQDDKQRVAERELRLVVE